MVRRLIQVLEDAAFPAGAAPGRVLPIEGIRGLAMLLVFLAHCSLVFRPWTAGEWTRSLFTIGQTGVDLFFVLSGYLIYSLALSHRGPWSAFLRRRARRIYPPFLAALTIYLALDLLLPQPSRMVQNGGLPYLLQCLLLLPGIFQIPPLFSVAWSLSYEALYYLLAPAFVVLFGLQRRTPAVRIALIVALGLAYTAMILAWFPAAWPGLRLQPWHHWRLLLFPAGMLAAEALRAGRGLPSAFHWPAAAFAAAVLGPWLLWLVAEPAQQPYTGLAASAGIGLAAALVFTTAFPGRGPLAAFFTWKPLRWLGNISYSFYLVHGIGLHAVLLAARPFPALPFWLLTLAAFAAASAISLILFVLIERRYSLQPPRIR